MIPTRLGFGSWVEKTPSGRGQGILDAKDDANIAMSGLRRESRPQLLDIAYNPG
jgi:hypothetical protein